MIWCHVSVPAVGAGVGITPAELHLPAMSNTWQPLELQLDFVDIEAFGAGSATLFPLNLMGLMVHFARFPLNVR